MKETLPAPTQAMDFIRQALDKQVPVETMEKLLAMRETLQREWARQRFYEALTAFQEECPEILKDQVVTNKDGTVRYKYASLDNIIKTIKPLLKRHGFSYRFESEFDSEAVVVSCIIQHIDGHSERASFRAPIDHSAHMSAVQKWGSALTYAKRYSLCLALGIVTDEDTDAVEESISQTEPEPAADMITEAQKKKMMVLFKELDIYDKETRLDTVRRILKREVQSSNELTKEEASIVIDRLQKEVKMLNTPEEERGDADAGV